MDSARIWDFWAGRYEGLWSQKYVLRPSRELVMKHLDGLDLDGKRILDIGCGIGQLAAEIADRFPAAAITATDISAKMIGRARRDFGRPNTEYRILPADGLEPEMRFDVAVCTNAFPYFPDGQATLQVLYGHMNRGGRLLVLNANLNTLYDRLWLLLVRLTTSQSRYPSVDGMRDMMSRAGFAVEGHERIRTAAFVPSVYLVSAEKM